MADPKPTDASANLPEQPAPQTTVQMPQIPPAELAAHTLRLLETAPMQANENSLVIAIQIRSLLAGIAGGQLIVGRPAQAVQPQKGGKPQAVK